MTNLTKGNMCSIELDQSLLYFDRFDPNWLRFDRLHPFCYVLNDSTRGKKCSIVFDEANYDTTHSTQVGYVSTESTEGKRFILCLTQVSFISTDSKLNCYVSTDLTKGKTMFDCIRSHTAMFQPTRLKLRYVSIESTKGKTFVTLFDPKVLCFDRFD